MLLLLSLQQCCMYFITSPALIPAAHVLRSQQALASFPTHSHPAPPRPHLLPLSRKPLCTHPPCVARLSHTPLSPHIYLSYPNSPHLKAR